MVHQIMCELSSIKCYLRPGVHWCLGMDVRVAVALSRLRATLRSHGDTPGLQTRDPEGLWLEERAAQKLLEGQRGRQEAL